MTLHLSLFFANDCCTWFCFGLVTPKWTFDLLVALVSKGERRAVVERPGLRKKYLVSLVLLELFSFSTSNVRTYLFQSASTSLACRVRWNLVFDFCYKGLKPRRARFLGTVCPEQHYTSRGQVSTRLFFVFWNSRQILYNC